VEWRVAYHRQKWDCPPLQEDFATHHVVHKIDPVRILYLCLHPRYLWRALILYRLLSMIRQDAPNLRWIFPIWFCQKNSSILFDGIRKLLLLICEFRHWTAIDWHHTHSRRQHFILAFIFSEKKISEKNKRETTCENIVQCLIHKY